MSAIRRVQATNPHTGKVVDRQSKTKLYTHALMTHHPVEESYTIPAGTYTVPKKRIRGRNIPSYQHTISRDHVAKGHEESWGIISFHTSFAAADKAGRAAVSQSASSEAEAQAVYGDLVAKSQPWVDRYQVIEVEVLDEGFNAK